MRKSEKKLKEYWFCLLKRNRTKTFLTMTKRISILILLFILLSFCTNAQKARITIPEYISTYRSIAIEEMKKYKIPASITIAQGILETDNGNSALARNANNHFGIKCKVEWTGKKYYYDDDAKNECFRKYDNPMDSYKDHSIFLTTRERYNFLFKLDISDYKGWAYGLKKAGYATNPTYAECLIKIIEDNKLYELDRTDNVAMIKEVKGSDSVERIVFVDTLKSLKTKNIDVTEDFSPVNISDEKRSVFLINGIKCIKANKDETFNSIAKDFNLAPWNIAIYNDMKPEDKLISGQLVFIEQKKRKGPIDFHFVVKGETMHSISQFYGIKLKILYKKNRMDFGMQPQAGEKIWLIDNKPRFK